jgi:hypothetical protein
MDGRRAALAAADALEELYTRVGVPTRLRQLGIPRGDLRSIADETVKNFNANAGARSAEERTRGRAAPARGRLLGIAPLSYARGESHAPKPCPSQLRSNL